MEEESGVEYRDWLVGVIAASMVSGEAGATVLATRQVAAQAIALAEEIMVRRSRRMFIQLEDENLTIVDLSGLKSASMTGQQIQLKFESGWSPSYNYSSAKKVKEDLQKVLRRVTMGDKNGTK